MGRIPIVYLYLTAFRFHIIVPSAPIQPLRKTRKRYEYEGYRSVMRNHVGQSYEIMCLKFERNFVYF